MKHYTSVAGQVISSHCHTAKTTRGTTDTFLIDTASSTRLIAQQLAARIGLDCQVAARLLPVLVDRLGDKHYPCKTINYSIVFATSFPNATQRNCALVNKHNETINTNKKELVHV